MNQRTQISTMRDMEEGQSIELYFRSSPEKSCFTCLNSKQVTGKDCPIFDPKTYSKDCRCPRFVNFLGFAKVTDVKKYDSFEPINSNEALLHAWVVAEGYTSFQEAEKHYIHLMGQSWKEYPLTVFKWEYKKK